MHPSNIVLLEFHPERDELCYGKELRDGLSVALGTGSSLWLANDESVSLERLTVCEEDSTGRSSFTREHRQYALHDYLDLPMPPHGAEQDDINEADIEGLACDGKYLWLAGSHSLRRKQPRAGDGARKASKRLASVSADGNRYLLARIPVLPDGDGYTLAREATHKDKPRRAALLRGDEHGNELTALLRQDEHLGPLLAIPGKDNGFDIMGPQPVRGISAPVISPDGRSVAFVALNDVWVMRIGQAPVRLTHDTARDAGPQFTPDGLSVYFSTEKDNAGALAIDQIEIGSMKRTRLAAVRAQSMYAPKMSPAGDRIAYSTSAGQIDIWDMASRTSRSVVTASGPLVSRPSWLPDGMKVARDGTLVCSVPGGMMILTPEAEPLGLISTGAPIANCAFGERGRALYLSLIHISEPTRPY